MSGLSALFVRHIAQTGPAPALLEVESADGIYIRAVGGKRYVDLNSGYCVSAIGHCHPRVVRAVAEQSVKYMHTSVYGEHVQSPQVMLAQRLTQQLDPSLDTVFFVNSGAEAIEGAMKLVKRATGRFEIIACHKSYHGSTQGADSLRSDIAYTNAFMPLLPGTTHITFSDFGDLDKITQATAAVIIEPVQGEAGVRLPDNGYLKALRARCDETGTLLVFDEIQTGMGRTGHFCAHQREGIVPDVLLLAKALGGGMPLGAIIAGKFLLQAFTHNPELGHLTTFGGHPVCCAAGLAALEVILEDDLIASVDGKAREFASRLEHPAIADIRQAGLLMGITLRAGFSAERFVSRAFETGVITDRFLFDENSFRIAPPLIISREETDKICETISEVLDAIAPS